VLSSYERQRRIEDMLSSVAYIATNILKKELGMSRVNGQKFTVLKNKKTVITRAGFWKVPHNTRDDDVYLKLGRYKKPKG